MMATAFVTNTRARAVQADHYADEIIEIVDTETDPVRARVRMDGRKWVASKLAPRKYGDRIDHGGQLGICEMSHEQWLNSLD